MITTVLRERKRNFMGFDEGFIPREFFHGETVQEVTEKLKKQYPNFTFIPKEDGSVEIKKENETIGILDTK